MNNKTLSVILSLTLMTPTIMMARPSSSALSSGSSVSSARSSSSFMRPSTASGALSQGVSSFERNASRHSWSGLRPESTPTPPPYPSQSSQASLSQPYTTRRDSPPVVVHEHYHNDNSGSSLAGFAAGMALGALASHHDEQQSVPAIAPHAPVYSDNSSSDQEHEGHGLFGFLFFLFMLMMVIVGAILYFVMRSERGQPDSQKSDESPNPQKKTIVPGFPSLIPGGLMTVDGSLFQSDPNSKNPGLHAQLDKVGTISIAGVIYGDNVATLCADTSFDEFAQIFINDDNQIEDARYYSYVYEYPILGAADWDTWTGKTGMIGNQWFQTGDNPPVKWKRELFSSTNSHIDPINTKRVMHTFSGDVHYDTCEMSYYRNTGFDKIYAQKEYLLVRAYHIIKNGKSSYFVRTYSGVSVPPASLQLQ